MNREQWLLDAVEIMRPWLEEAGKPLPETVRVSVGWPKGKRKTTIGVCHSGNSSEDGIHQIFISPAIAEPIQVLATLLHELIHAADDCQNGHRKEFSRVAAAVGLVKPWTATSPGDDLRLKLQDVLGKLGEYPHAVLTARPRGSVGSRMLKVHAPNCCKYIARTTAKWVNEQGLPLCPHGEEMELAS